MIGKNIKILKGNRNGNKKQSVGIEKGLVTEAIFAAIEGTISYSKIARVLSVLQYLRSLKRTRTLAAGAKISDSRKKACSLKIAT